MKIYHNPRCRKSREGLAFLEQNRYDFAVVRYLENPLTRQELLSIIEKLEVSPIDLIRRSESVWKENFKGKTLSDQELVEAMLQFPKLMERPIVVHNERAIIARPAERIKDIL
ncbi:MAG: arsenate reductase (glutaredoxin) [Bacteroidota bacterium]